MKTTRSRAWFELGCLSTYAIHVFTGMGEFKSHDEAVAYYRSQPRSVSDTGVVTIKTTDVGYGHKQELRTLLGTIVPS